MLDWLSRVRRAEGARSNLSQMSKSSSGKVDWGQGHAMGLCRPESFISDVYSLHPYRKQPSASKELITPYSRILFIVSV